MSTQQNEVYVVDIPKINHSNSFYVSNCEPLLVSPFVKLPLGSIQAKGWMHHQLKLMADGMTGHLQELSHFLRTDNGWLGGDNEGWEEQPYWLRGFHDLGVLLKDEHILKEAKHWIETIIVSQDKDGYFGPKSRKCVIGKNGQKLADLWPHMVILDVLITHYEHSNDERIIPLITRFFQWCAALPDNRFLKPDEGFGDGKLSVQWARAGDMLPHIYWLYNHKKEVWLLDLATRFYQKIKPPEGKWLDHHVVNFTQRFRYPGTYYVQSHNPAHIAETERWYKQHIGIWGQQPGGIFAADERIRPGKTDPKQACETCAMVEFNKSFYILGKITGQALYADRCEDIQFNSFPVTQTPDLKALHYLTA
ncbi:MAG: glycoside hydrolase family 127 protein, partial [Acidobacteriota bacterium]|nr:glycoside hydrolase family 127 protein [Acidobacteriota bacterium]